MYDERPGGGARRAPPDKGGRIGRTVLVLAVLAAVLAGAALCLVRRSGWQSPQPGPVTFQYRERTLEALEGVPVNEYDPDGFALDGKGRVIYEKNGVRARTGVDVSFYQKEIDWQAVAADGIDFAILRLGYRGYTEGGLNMDSCFVQNLQGALDAGLEVGVYFFSQAITPEEAEEEAGYVLDALGGQALSYPIAFDWEPIVPGRGARTDGLDGGTLTQCAAAFCSAIREAGYSPVVYLNQEQGYFSYDLRQLSDCALWLAEYDSSPDFYYHFDLWQYTHTGQVAGIQGNVDLDLDLRIG